MLVTKGVGVAFLAYHMHRSKEIYGADADEFRPERWEGPELKNIGFSFMPFHGGPRLCLGSKIPNLLQCNRLVSKTYAHVSCLYTEDFALSEASYGLVRVLQTFP
jgi:hypothetical protein